MATSPQASTLKKDKKDESLLEKLGTLGRKKKVKEVQQVVEEGQQAIDSPGSPGAIELEPEDFKLAEYEERSQIDPTSLSDPKVKELCQILIDWLNDELAEFRVLVRNLEEDLFDGQILHMLIEKLSNEKVPLPGVIQSEIGQRNKLAEVLRRINAVLNIPPSLTDQMWSVNSIHSKNLVSILFLLVHLARHFCPPIRLPENVIIHMIVIQKKEGMLHRKKVSYEITKTNDDFGPRFERDAFDTLFDHAPDKLNIVKKSLINFVNKHLGKINLEVVDLESQFQDGVYLVLLMGLLEGYFVPLYSFHLTPSTNEQKVHNVAFAFELMQDSGMPKPKSRPEDIVNQNMKCTLRVLYNLFTKYKNIS